MRMVRPRVGVVMTVLELYRQFHPDTAPKLGSFWRGVLENLLPERADIHFTDVAHTREEVAAAVGSCEKADCDLLIVLPLTYAASGCARDALVMTSLPLLVLSTARDGMLPFDMTGEHIMANHAMHGVQDLANVLTRAGREFELIAGHPSDARFRDRLLRCVTASCGARVLRQGKAGRIGKAFDDMLDFTFDRRTLADVLGFEVVELGMEELVAAASKISPGKIVELVEWMKKEFDVDPQLSAEELDVSARWSLALEGLVESARLDAVSMNFLDVGRSGAGTVPFLGASRLMARGIGYAGEGDVLTAALVAAVARMTGAATFTEMFCPDYARSEVLLSHMGECNFALGESGKKAKLMAKEFPYASCARPAVPVFQLQPGMVTLASLTEWPMYGFKLVAFAAEVVSTPEHPNLTSPYARIACGEDLGKFLEEYSRAGGTHHLALAYGDLREDLRIMAGLCRIGFESI